MKNFLNAAEFNKVANIEATNCFAFALGLTADNGFYELQRKDVDGCNVNIAVAFKQRAALNGVRVKKVTKLEETQNQVAFLVFGWYRFADFHVVRKNADGTFEHKPDWHEPASLTTWEKIRQEYQEDYQVFVLD